MVMVMQMATTMLAVMTEAHRNWPVAVAVGRAGDARRKKARADTISIFWVARSSGEVIDYKQDWGICWPACAHSGVPPAASSTWQSLFRAS